MVSYWTDPAPKERSKCCVRTAHLPGLPGVNNSGTLF